VLTESNPGYVAPGTLHRHWVDTIRVVTIGLVVLHHALVLNGAPATHFNQMLTLLRVPLFFMLSGFLLSETTLGESFMGMLRKYARSLVVPYLLLGGATWLAWTLKINLIDHAGMPLERQLRSLVGLFYGVSGPRHWMEFNEAIWFLPCLALLHLGYFVLRRLVPSFRTRLAIAAVIGFGGQLVVRFEPALPPWSADIVLVVMPFYALGQVARERAWLERLCGSRARRVVVALCAGSVLAAVYLLGGAIDINMRVLGNPLGLYVGGAAGFLFMVMAAIALPGSQLLRRMARNNLTVLCVHIPVLLYAASAAHYLFGERVSRIHAGLAFSATVTLVALAISAALGELLRHYLPFVVGVRSQPPPVAGAQAGNGTTAPRYDADLPRRHAA
jgi:fucose 4-O-acetylase-like acetyltransferase